MMDFVLIEGIFANLFYPAGGNLNKNAQKLAQVRTKFVLLQAEMKIYNNKSVLFHLFDANRG